MDYDGVVLSLFLKGRILFIHLLIDDVFGCVMVVYTIFNSDWYPS